MLTRVLIFFISMERNTAALGEKLGEIFLSVAVLRFETLSEFFLSICSITVKKLVVFVQ